LEPIDTRPMEPGVKEMAKRFGWKVVVKIFFFVSITLFGLAYLQMTVGGLWKTQSLNNSSFSPCKSNSISSTYCLKLAPEWAAFPNSYIKLVRIRENENYLHSQDEWDTGSAKLRQGWYTVLKDFLVISPIDGSDPRINQKSYQIVQPIPFPLVALGILGVCVACAVYLLKSELQVKLILPVNWFFIFFVAAKSFFPGILWWVLAAVNLFVIYYLLKDFGSRTLNRKQMLAYLAVVAIIMYGFLEIR